MNTTTYTSPVDKLLTLGEAEFVLQEKWPDYPEIGLGPEHIPELIRMATDRELRNIEAEEAEEEDPEFWASIHAIRALGQLHAEAAIEPLVNLLPELKDDEWMLEELPSVYGLIGPAAVPALEAYLSDSSHEMYSRSYAANGLVEIGERHPESRSECIAAISKQLEAFEENDYELNAFLISDLSHLKAVETLPLIERAFAADRVDEFVIGLDDVLVRFGLKEREEVQFQNPFGNLLERRGTPLKPEQIRIVPPNTPDNQPLAQRATGKTIKFSGKKVTKKHKKKKRKLRAFTGRKVDHATPRVLFTGLVKLPISTSGNSCLIISIIVRIPRALPIDSRAGMRGNSTSGSILRLRNWMSRRPVSFTNESRASTSRSRSIIPGKQSRLMEL